MSKALQKLTGTTSPSQNVVIFIHQIRHEDAASCFRNPETTGRATRSSLRLRCVWIYQAHRRHQRGGEGEGDRKSTPNKVTVVKNKLAPPFREWGSKSCTAEGSSRRATPRLAAEGERVEKSGAWFRLGSGEPIGQGREKCQKELPE